MSNENDVSRETRQFSREDVARAFGVPVESLPDNVSRETESTSTARLCGGDGCNRPVRAGGRYCSECHATASRAHRARHRRPVSPINAKAAAHVLLLLLCAGQAREWIPRSRLIKATQLTRSTFYRRLSDLQAAGFPVEAFSDGSVAYSVDPAAVPPGTSLRIVGALVADFGLCVTPIDPELIRITQAAGEDGAYLDLFRYLDAARAFEHKPRQKRKASGD